MISISLHVLPVFFCLSQHPQLCSLSSSSCIVFNFRLSPSVDPRPFCTTPFALYAPSTVFGFYSLCCFIASRHFGFLRLLYLSTMTHSPFALTFPIVPKVIHTSISCPAQPTPIYIKPASQKVPTTRKFHDIYS